MSDSKTESSGVSCGVIKEVFGYVVSEDGDIVKSERLMMEGMFSLRDYDATPLRVCVYLRRYRATYLLTYLSTFMPTYVSSRPGMFRFGVGRFFSVL